MCWSKFDEDYWQGSRSGSFCSPLSIPTASETTPVRFSPSPSLSPSWRAYYSLHVHSGYGKSWLFCGPSSAVRFGCLQDMLFIRRIVVIWFCNLFILFFNIYNIFIFQSSRINIKTRWRLLICGMIWLRFCWIMMIITIFRLILRVGIIKMFHYLFWISALVTKINWNIYLSIN